MLTRCFCLGVVFKKALRVCKMLEGLGWRFRTTVQQSLPSNRSISSGTSNGWTRIQNTSLFFLPGSGVRHARRLVHRQYRPLTYSGYACELCFRSFAAGKVRPNVVLLLLFQ